MSPAPPQHARRKRRRPSVLLLAAALVAIAAAGYLVLRARDPAPSSPVGPAPAVAHDIALPPATMPPSAADARAAAPPAAPGALPPLPDIGFPPSRPIEVVRAAYRFAAEHPEVLRHVPCFCGCERNGHRGNDDCFVESRDSSGRVTSWTPHGMG
jgi:hypothetical protein